MSYVARGENLRRRKKPKSINFSGRFLSLPSEIVALRFLRIRSEMLPMKPRSCLHSQPGGINGTSTHPSPFPWIFFFYMIVIYAIVSRDVLLKHLRCRSFFRSAVKSKYQGLLTFQIRYKVLKRGGNLSLLALMSVNISRDIFTFLRELH